MRACMPRVQRVRTCPDNDGGDRFAAALRRGRSMIAAPPRFITRSADHHYTFDGVTYPGVTGILSVLDKSGPLMHWASKMTAEAAIDLGGTLPQLVETVGREGAIKALMERRTTKNEDAKQLGTDVHAIADLIATGGTPPAMTPVVMARVDGYEKWLRASGWQIRCSEGMIVNPVAGYGGTLDLLAYDREGNTVLADIKTGKVDYRGKLYDTILLQLAAYAGGQWLDMGDGKLYAMPHVDRYAVIHVTEDGTVEKPAQVGQPELDAFVDALRLSRWRDSLKGQSRV